MKKLNALWYIGLICLLVTGCNNTNGQETLFVEEIIPMETRNPQEQELPTIETLDELPISRAMVAKMIALAFSTESECRAGEDVTAFTDVANDSWYKKYVSRVVGLGYMAGTGTQFEPNAYLSINQAQQLIDRMDKNNTIQIKITDENRDLPISHALWQDLYNRVLTKLAGAQNLEEQFGIKQQEMVILATPHNSQDLPMGTLITDQGVYYCVGFDMDGYLDKKVTVQIKEREIIGLLGDPDETPVIENAYIVSCEEGKLTLFSGGAKRTYEYEGTVDQAVTIADIQISNGRVTGLIPVADSREGEIKRVLDKSLEMEGSGLLGIAPEVKIYEAVDQSIKWRTHKDIIVGTNDVTCYVKNGEICAVVINAIPQPEEMRVTISTTDGDSCFHAGVSLTCTTGYIVKTDSGEKKYNQGELLVIDGQNNTDLFGSLRITIVPESEDGRIQIQSIRRANTPLYPEYRGSMEIAKAEKAFTITNIIPFEEYLIGVITSQTDTDWPLEALKAQAVTARSTAYNQYYSNSYRAYGGQVDDTTASQRYMVAPENETVIEAVEATAGYCLISETEVIAGNFFHTSAGYTANAGEIWPDKKTGEYPCATPDYLQSVKQIQDDITISFEAEDGALAFYKDNNIKSWDSSSIWSRWQLPFTIEAASAAINENISNKAGHFEVLDVNGNVVESDITSIGTLKDIEVVKRGAGGNAMVVEITGTQSSIRIKEDGNIRTMLKPVTDQNDDTTASLYLQDGSIVSSFSQLPSAFFAIEKTMDEEGNLSSFSLFGGGNGHGVGMSQSGVKAMANADYSYEQILRHYFKGTQLKQCFDAG